MSQYCTDAQADGAGIAMSPMSVQIPLPNLSHATQMTPSCFSQEHAVCFCSAKQWPRSKQQRLHIYALVLEQDSHSLNHHLQSPTAETFVIRNL